MFDYRRNQIKSKKGKEKMDEKKEYRIQDTEGKNSLKN